jgi:hypothetical protein
MTTCLVTTRTDARTDAWTDTRRDEPLTCWRLMLHDDMFANHKNGRMDRRKERHKDRRATDPKTLTP